MFVPCMEIYQRLMVRQKILWDASANCKKVCYLHLVSLELEHDRINRNLLIKFTRPDLFKDRIPLLARINLQINLEHYQISKSCF
jgi:hypothetical protein